MKLQFKLAENSFDGPLDLLLQLISKHKIEICDIEISQLLSQFVDAIDYLKSENMEVSSEFLEMASRLLYIKTLSLLPKHEEADQLKEELCGELLEYQTCKEMAKKLEAGYIGDLLFSREKIEFQTDRTYRQKHEKTEIAIAYLSTLTKKRLRIAPPASAFSGIVGRRPVSVAAKIISLLKSIIKNKKYFLKNIYDGNRDRSEIVATFLALLELLRSKRVFIKPDETLIINKDGKGKA